MQDRADSTTNVVTEHITILADRTGGVGVRRRINRTGLYILVAMLAVVAVMAAMHLSGLVHNFTDSVPKGFYRIVDREPRKGDYIIIEPPDNNFTRLRKMKGIIKTLAATTGDRVTIDDHGITVNGDRLEKSAPLPTFATLITRENIDTTLTEGGIVVYSGYSPLSYDSRYFGVIKTTAIRNVIEPIYIWGTGNKALDLAVKTIER